MGMMERPVVTALADGGKYWEHTFESFCLKAYVPATKINGQVNNYTFRAPLLLVFEEKQSTMEEAIRFADESGLAKDFEINTEDIFKACDTKRRERGGFEDGIYLEWVEDKGDN